MTGTPSPSTGAFRLTPRFWIVLGIAIVLIVAVVLAGVLYARAGTGTPSADDAGTQRPVPSDIPGASAAPKPEPTPTIDPNDTRPRPADCAALFSAYVTDQMPEGIVLNPEWAASEGMTSIGIGDPELAKLIDASEKLSCTWASPDGPAGTFIRTNFAWVTDDVQQTAIDRLNALGYDCYEELGGTRCTIDESDDTVEAGESHFLREGVWIVSRWLDLAPDGYTHDIIANTFG